MEILQAILLGIVEGLTEFLPISSTGHLIVAADVMNYKDTAEIFTVVVQMGAIAAVIWFYKQQLAGRITGLIKRDRQAVNFIANWAIATAPAVVVAFLLKDVLDTYAVALTVGIALIIGGVAIWLIEHYNHAPKSPKSGDRLDELTHKQALKVGLYQIVALIPGVSRSGATIMGGLLSGMDRVTATAFSFYLSIPIIIMAGTYQLISGRDEFDTVTGGGPALLVGTIAAFFTALIAIKWLLKYVSKHDFKGFAYYRVIVGIIILLIVV
jgi:undecaprenyl-diphosphatase